MPTHGALRLVNACTPSEGPPNGTNETGAGERFSPRDDVTDAPETARAGNQEITTTVRTNREARTSNPDDRQTPSFRTDFTFDNSIQAICQRLLPRVLRWGVLPVPKS